MLKLNATLEHDGDTIVSVSIEANEDELKEMGVEIVEIARAIEAAVKEGKNDCDGPCPDCTCKSDGTYDYPYPYNGSPGVTYDHMQHEETDLEKNAKMAFEMHGIGMEGVDDPFYVIDNMVMDVDVASAIVTDLMKSMLLHDPNIIFEGDYTLEIKKAEDDLEFAKNYLKDLVRQIMGMLGV